MIRIHYFSYSREAGILPASVASLMRSMTRGGYVMGSDYDVTVVDDIYHPLPDAARDVLVGMGVRYRWSTYDRGGNLRGQACLMGILSDYGRTLDGSMEDVVVKLDPDTIVRRTDWMRGLGSEDGCDLVYCDDRGAMYGMCYGVTAPLVVELIRYLAVVPVPDQAPEDIYLGHRLRSLAVRPRQIPLWQAGRHEADVNGPDGRISCYNWGAGRGRMAHVYDQFDVVNIGQSRQPWVTDEMAVSLIGLLVPDLTPSTVAAPGPVPSVVWTPSPTDSLL